VGGGGSSRWARKTGGGRGGTVVGSRLRAGRGTEGAPEEAVDRRAAVRPQEARPGAGEERVRDHGLRHGLPRLAGPARPAVAILVEDVEALVEELGVLRAHAGAAHDGTIGLDLPDQEDVLAVVDLVPDALQHLAEQRRVRVAPGHQPAHVGEADVAVLELGVGQDADAARARVAVALEGEVHLLDAVALGALAEGGLGALCGAAEEDALVGLHGGSSGAALSPIRLVP